MTLILWAPCLLKKRSFYIIGKQTSVFLCSQLYLFIWNKLDWMGCKSILNEPNSIFIDSTTHLITNSRWIFKNHDFFISPNNKVKKQTKKYLHIFCDYWRLISLLEWISVVLLFLLHQILLLIKDTVKLDFKNIFGHFSWSQVVLILMVLKANLAKLVIGDLVFKAKLVLI